MAIITGILVRVLHAAFNAHGDLLDWRVFAGRFLVIPVVLLGGAAIHLAQYPVRQWLWRAPAFAVIEGLAGALASLVLIAFERERIGTARAEFAHWPGIVGGILGWHLIMVSFFALALGVIVQWVRRREYVSLHRHEHLLTHPPGHEATGEANGEAIHESPHEPPDLFDPSSTKRRSTDPTDTTDR